ncbi:sporulation protein [Flavonifractor sp. An10]|uniref:sporulation protein n=1 Tax=Flavonifractor sp. An10 TaxID=1965537 RepID=UPI000B368CC2|nr:sporulation protein [Flavonifractor sp. An10]OUQ79085.1 sporulation protein [Flavonifractor sp. An10]
MNWLSALTAAALFAAACNLDTVLLSAGFAARGVVLRRGYGLVIAALTTLITWLSLALGAGAAALLGGRTAQVLGGLVLAGMGAWFLLDWLRRPGPPPEGAEEAEAAAGLRGCVALAAALAVNNAGAGAAAGVSGISPGLAAAANLLATLGALPLGRMLGSRLAGRLLGKYALPLTGGLLILLGLWEAAPLLPWGR